MIVETFRIRFETLWEKNKYSPYYYEYLPFFLQDWKILRKKLLRILWEKSYNFKKYDIQKTIHLQAWEYLVEPQ